MAVHALAHAELAVLGHQLGHVILRDEVVQIVAGFENDITTAPAIAAARAALRNVLFARERHTAFAAMARARVNFNFVDEHD